MVLCPRCGKDFSSHQALHYHLFKRKQKCKNIHKCKCCKLMFRDKKCLEIHDCNPLWKNIANSLSTINIYILDENWYTILSNTNDYFLLKYPNVSKNVTSRKLCKSINNIPYHISIFRLDNLYLVLEEPYKHPLYREGFLTP